MAGGKAGKDSGKTKQKAVSRSARAGLQFPVGRSVTQIFLFCTLHWSWMMFWRLLFSGSTVTSSRGQPHQAESAPLPLSTAPPSLSISPPRFSSWQGTLPRIWRWRGSLRDISSWPSVVTRSWTPWSRQPLLEAGSSHTSTSRWLERRERAPCHPSRNIS